jgi:tripartite ATP-independent transporter DctM subunit
MAAIAGIFAFILLTLGVPIYIGLGMALYVVAIGLGTVPPVMVFQQMFQGLSSFVLLAIPLFILAGELMMRAKIIDDIITLCNILVGGFRGGLAHVNIVACMFFAGITGSAVSETAAIGSILIPSMKRNGYGDEFPVALTAAASVIGPIIPPSIPMVLYGSVVSASIGGLFFGGVVPGIMLGLGLMLVAGFISHKRKFPVSYRKMTLAEVGWTIIRSLPALMMPMIILGGILGGVFTATEAAAVAVAYSILVGVFFYRTLTLADIVTSVKVSMIVASNILVIVAVSNPLGWIVALDLVPQRLAAVVTGFSTEPWVVLLIINVFLLILGSVMDASANILIFAPIFAPLAISVGVDPLHFGVVFVLNLVIGLATPPFGMCLFVAAAIGKISFERTVKEIIPFVLVEILVLILVTYYPPLALWVPRALGF